MGSPDSKPGGSVTVHISSAHEGRDAENATDEEGLIFLGAADPVSRGEG